jgi:hypothetical protein
METGFWTSVWSFFKFLPFFFGLLLLGIIKGELHSCCVGTFCLVASLFLCLFFVALEDSFLVS